ncbi:hypothetical protein [Sphingomonas sp.]|uniref:hypothetical protein n=1 Tax=Sphingomonas sp. TaxID=28214 RepID=UPI00286C8683|nr:hypothetical protein [Sphingomonas sp.]
MNKTLTIVLVAVAALAGCNKSTPAANEAAAAEANAAAQANVVAEMPAAIVASKIYRCKDNSVVYIDWLAGDTTADIRSEQGGAATVLKADATGGALKAEGYALIGLPTAKVVTLTRPGKGEQACKA